jgi:hypothetical protein
MGTSAGHLAPAKQRLYEQLVDALHALFGVHPGYQPLYAKGIVCEGPVHPAATAASGSRAPHLQSVPVPITVRFSDFAGAPTVPDGDPLASLRGITTKFHLPGQIDTDLVAQSYDGFPTHTSEEFLEFVRALAARGLEHPWALAFLPDGRLLVTEWPGLLVRLDTRGRPGHRRRAVPRRPAGAYSRRAAGAGWPALPPDRQPRRASPVGAASGAPLRAGGYLSHKSSRGGEED